MLSKRNARCRFRGARRQGRCTRASCSCWDALGLKAAEWLVSRESLGCISRSPNLCFYDFALRPRKKNVRISWSCELVSSKSFQFKDTFFLFFVWKRFTLSLSRIQNVFLFLLCMRDLTTVSKWYDHHPTINAARDNMSALLLFVGHFLLCGCFGHHSKSRVWLGQGRWVVSMRGAGWRPSVSYCDSLIKTRLSESRNIGGGGGVQCPRKASTWSATSGST